MFSIWALRSVAEHTNSWYNKAEKRHQSVIDAQAEKGWRYVGYVPLDFNPKGAPISIDLIFERRVD